MKYTIDAWGNLTTKAVQPGYGGEGLASGAATNANQLPGYTYDGGTATVGNVTFDGSNNYTYDSENRIVSASGVTYTYDGDGERVQKSNGKSYWGGSNGEPLLETDNSGNAQNEYVYFNGSRIARRAISGGLVHYTFDDILKSATVIADNTGAIQKQYDYAPYGELHWQSGSDPNHYQFTGKERDTETGLDYFGARYYCSNMGRFMSPDDVRNDSNVADPQSWNLYSYVRNNPLRYTDPDGKEATVTKQCSNDGKTCQVNVSASIAIYSVDGTTQAQLQQAQAAITTQVQAAWSGSFTQDGVTYNVSTTVNVSIAGSEQAAFNSGAQNAVGIDASGNAQNHLDAGPRGSGQDRGTWDFSSITSGQLAPHEFSHIVGLDDNHGNNLSNSFSPASMGNHPHATPQDLQWAFGPELHDRQTKFNVGQREGRDWLNRNRGNRHWWEVFVKQKDSD